jgi:hypothetical protein
MESHKEASKGEPAQSAGVVSLWHLDGKLVARMEDPWSSSLGIGVQAEHEIELESILGVPVKSRWEDL